LRTFFCGFSIQGIRRLKPEFTGILAPFPVRLRACEFVDWAGSMLSETSRQALSTRSA
jgi:hypothetical protein